MAIRNDLTFDWTASPRIITVDAPSAEITMQDLYDTCRDAEVTQVDEAYIIAGAGKEPLGGGVTVGLTLTLNNALVAFEARSGPTYVQCIISGGNLVAIDVNGDPVTSSVSPTAFTQIVQSNSSSATLQELDAIQFSSYNGGVTIDPIEGGPGEEYPWGTPFQPVDNIADALTIVANQNLPKKLMINSDITLGVGAALDEYLIEGKSHVQVAVQIDAGADVEDVTIYAVRLTGVLDGSTEIAYSIIGTVDYINGHIHDSSLNGVITLGGSEDAYIVDCNQLDMNIEPEINMGGSGQNLVMPEFVGIIHIKNMNGSNKVGIGLGAGQIILHSDTVTSGLIHVSGIGSLLDEAGNHIHAGTWNGGVTIINELLDKTTIGEGVWEANDVETQVDELHKLQGLKVGSPMTVTPTTRTVDDIDQDITGDGETTTTVERQP